MTSLEVFSGDVHPPVVLCPARKDDGMVGASQFFDGHMVSNGDVAQEIEARRAGNLFKDANGLLELLVVRSDPASHQPERCGQALEHIDLYVEARGQQRFGSIETARAATDDRNVDAVAAVHTVAPSELEAEFNTPSSGRRQWLLLIPNNRKLSRTRRVDRDPRRHLLRQIQDVINGMHGARIDTGAAIDAALRIDIKSLIIAVEA
jgi:hypothetical protein